MERRDGHAQQVSDPDQSLAGTTRFTRPVMGQGITQFVRAQVGPLAVKSVI